MEQLFYPPHPMGRGICRLDPPEGAFIYNILLAMGDKRVLEIGRFSGGSTMLLAYAVGREGKVTSVDLDPRCDDVLMSTLNRWGWGNRVELLVGDSRHLQNRGRSFDAMFIDGDHTYDGVKADFEHWEPTLRTGGHALFHDDADRPNIRGVWRFCRELDARKGWSFIGRERSVSFYRKDM